MQCQHRQLKDMYGTHGTESHPEVVKLKEKMDAMFQVKTHRTAMERYMAMTT